MYYSYISSRTCCACLQGNSVGSTSSISARMVRLRLQRRCLLRRRQIVRPSKDQLHEAWRNENRKKKAHNVWYSLINPNKPRILPKISTTRILTNRFGSAASARAAVEPAIPTQMPQSKLHAPTVIPPQKTAKPSGG